MNEELFAYIKKQKISPTKIDKEIKSWSFEKCSEFINKCDEMILYKSIPSPTLFSFVASGSFGGGISDCYMPECRVKKIDSLARFSTFYSDRVLIQNPFDKYHEIKSFKNDPTYLKQLLLGDLKVLFKIEPLIIADLVGISKSQMCFCPECLKKVIKRKKEISSKIKKGEKVLLKKYLDKTNLRCKKISGEMVTYLSGPEELIEHSEQIFILGKEHPLQKYYNKSKATNFQIKDRNIKKKFLLRYLSPIFEDMLLQDTYSYVHGYNSITNKETDLFVRRNIETVSKNLKISKLMKGLTHAVPNLENISIKNLIDLRIQGEESFKVYRDTVTKVMQKIKIDTDEEEVKSLVQSEIIPEINNLDMLLKNIRKNATQSFIKKMVLGSSYIFLGLFSGFVPTNIGGILAGLGGHKFIEGVTDDLIKKYKIPSEIERSKYYFLWKARRL